MATKSLNVVTLSAPTEGINKAVNETFVMSQSYTLTGNGGTPTVNLTWQCDGVDIPASGSTGLVADLGVQNSATEATTYNRTITCKSAGAYVIRAKAVDVTTPVTKYSTNTPTVTVTSEPIQNEKSIDGTVNFAGDVASRCTFGIKIGTVNIVYTKKGRIK